MKFGLLCAIICVFIVTCSKKDPAYPFEQDRSASEFAEHEIPVTGGQLVLKNTATAVFDSATFLQSVNCQLSRTKDTFTQNEFEIAALLFGMKNRFNYEIRINTGKNIPNKKISVDINLPDTFTANMKENFGIRGYALLNTDMEGEKLEYFDAVSSTYYSTTKLLKLEIDPMYFSSSSSKDGSYQAVLSVGITPGANPSAGRTMNDCSGGLFISCPVNNCTVNSPFQATRLNPVTHVNSPHRGADLKADASVVKAAYYGIVVKVTEQVDRQGNSTGWGKYIIVQHGSDNENRFATLYGHLEEQSVQEGQIVEEDQQVGISGETGGAAGPHLHFEYITNADIADKEARVDPMPYVNTTSPRVISASVNITGSGCATGGSANDFSTWVATVKYKTLPGAVGKTIELHLDDASSSGNANNTIKGGVLATNTGTLTSSPLCVKWGVSKLIKLRAYIRLSNGQESNCVFVNLVKPTSNQPPQVTLDPCPGVDVKSWWNGLDANLQKAFNEQVSLSGTAYPDTPSLIRLFNLTTLDLKNKHLQGSLVLPKCFYALSDLYCDNNLLTSVDVSALAQLNNLSCKSNKLTSVKFNKANLVNFESYNNQLTNLDFRDAKKLKYLECDKNKLSSLDVSGATELTTLLCDSNRLATLNISGDTKLARIQCYYNQLTTVNLAGLKNLQHLSCERNFINKLDIRDCENLEALYCFFNKLTSLDASGLSKLRYMWCDYNELNDLKCTGLAAMENFRCGNNQLGYAVLLKVMQDIPATSTFDWSNCYYNKIADGNGPVATIPYDGSDCQKITDYYNGKFH